MKYVPVYLARLPSRIKDIKIMKKQVMLILILLAATFLSACGGSSKSPEGEKNLNQVLTEVAMTVTAQSFLPTITNTPTELTTSTPQTTPTQFLIEPTQTPYTGSLTYCDNSAYVSDVTIPDGTIVTPGSSFTKTWGLQNTGTCNWTTSYSIVFVSGSAMSGVTTALAKEVVSGDTTNISIKLVAPTSAGTYTGYWRLQNASASVFGQAVYVNIVVSAGASTLTPTTSTTTADTSTPTPTTEPTATPEATEITEPTVSSTDISWGASYQAKQLDIPAIPFWRLPSIKYRDDNYPSMIR
jgi:hypothetical protein